jgi:hypothetical protein
MAPLCSSRERVPALGALRVVPGVLQLRRDLSLPNDRRPQGRPSTHGVCLGALSWAIERGRAGQVDLSGLHVVLALRYSDDEPGSPWTFRLYLDERGEQPQHDALAEIFLGRLGGTPLKQFPWAFKDSNPLGVRTVTIEIDHTPGRGWFRAGSAVTVRIREPVPEQEPVTCIIPGHHRSGRELYPDVLTVEDEPLEFEFSDTCAYESSFSYSSNE